MLPLSKKVMSHIWDVTSFTFSILFWTFFYFPHHQLCLKSSHSCLQFFSSWLLIPQLGSHLNSLICSLLNLQISSHFSISFPSTQEPLPPQCSLILNSVPPEFSTSSWNSFQSCMPLQVETLIDLYINSSNDPWGKTVSSWPGLCSRPVREAFSSSGPGEAPPLVSMAGRRTEHSSWSALAQEALWTANPQALPTSGCCWHRVRSPVPFRQQGEKKKRRAMAQNSLTMY